MAVNGVIQQAAQLTTHNVVLSLTVHAGLPPRYVVKVRPGDDFTLNLTL
jgi:hypothetical protein